MKLDEADIRLALESGDCRGAAEIILRHFNISADLRHYVVSFTRGKGSLPFLQLPSIAVYFLEGGFAAWSPEEGFARDETRYTYMFKGNIRIEEC